MSDYAFLTALLASMILLDVWRKYTGDNRRDARLPGEEMKQITQAPLKELGS